MTWTTPKTDWNNGELVTAADINAIGENLAALKQPATAAYTTTAEIIGRTETFADVHSNMRLTLATTGGDVLVHFHGSMEKVDHSLTMLYCDIDIDGTRQGGEFGISRAYIDANDRAVSFTHLIQNLSAGSHIFRLQWKVQYGTVGVRLFAGAQFWVREI
ncbi:MAG: hypothetical protein OXG60_20890 [Chloroflexi bacterium]|nr:hypothetical protein [Chloroflexota bacterium]